MKRRTALKNIGLSFGALTLTPTVASLLQSCQTTEAGWTPTFLSQEHAEAVAKIVDVILPSTTDVPGATDLNLIQFIDGYLSKVSSLEEQEFFKMATVIFLEITQKAAGKDNSVDLSAADIDVQLNHFLRATPEEQATRGRAFETYLDGIEGGNELTPPLEGVSQNYLYNLRSLAIRAFEGNAIIGKEHLAYAPVPGQQNGCIDLEEATAGKAWAL